MSKRGESVISTEDAEEFTQSLGQIFGGGWRQIAWAEQQGIPAALGLSTEDWVNQRLGGYVRLAVSERREAVRELHEEGMTQREIGAALGVDHSTVSDDLRGGRKPGGNPPPKPEHTQPDLLEQSEPGGNPPPIQDQPPKQQPISPEEAQARRAEREHQQAIGRYVSALAAFLSGWDTAVHLAGDPNRADVLDALEDFDRKRFLEIEEKIHDR